MPFRADKQANHSLSKRYAPTKPLIYKSPNVSAGHILVSLGMPLDTFAGGACARTVFWPSLKRRIKRTRPNRFSSLPPTELLLSQTTATGFAPDQDSRSFRKALGQFATGVCVITTTTEMGQDVGITANSFASVSLDPPLVLWSPAKAARRFEVYAEAEYSAIHVLEKSQLSVALGFVREANAFGKLSLRRNDHDIPLIDGALAVFECKRVAVHDAGDHAILVDRVTHAHLSKGTPLTFSQGAYCTTAPLEE